MSSWSMRLGCLVLAVLVVGLAAAPNEQGRRASGQESSSSNVTSMLPEDEVPSTEEFPQLAAEKSVLPLVHSDSGVGRHRRSTTNDICVVKENDLDQLLDELNDMHSAQQFTQHGDNCLIIKSRIKDAAGRFKEVVSTMMKNRDTDDNYGASKDAYSATIKTLDEQLLSIGEEVDQQYKPLFEQLEERMILVRNNLNYVLLEKITLQAAYDNKKNLHDSLLGYFIKRKLDISPSQVDGGLPRPFTPPATCELSSAWLTELLGILQGTLRVMVSAEGTMPSQGDTPTDAEYSSDSCWQPAIESIGHLKINFKVLAGSDDGRAKKHARQSSTFQTEIGILKKRVVDARQEYTQHWERKLKKMRQDLQSQTSDLNTALEENEKLREMVKNETIAVCITLIKKGGYHAAMQQLNELNAEEQVGKIVKGAYDNNIRNAKHVLSFIHIRQSLSERALGYEVLFEEMKRNRHLGSPQVLGLACQIEEAIEMALDQNAGRDIKDKLQSLRSDLNPYERNVIAEIAGIVSAGDPERASAYFVSGMMKSADTCNDHYVIDIIDMAYAINGHLDNVDKFNHKLPLSQSIVGTIRRTDHFLKEVDLLVEEVKKMNSDLDRTLSSLTFY